MPVRHSKKYSKLGQMKNPKSEDKLVYLKLREVEKEKHIIVGSVRTHRDGRSNDRLS